MRSRLGVALQAVAAAVGLGSGIVAAERTHARAATSSLTPSRPPAAQH